MNYDIIDRLKKVGADVGFLGALTEVEREKLAEKIERLLADECRKGEQFMWNLAHEPARCGHARANYKDPEWGTPAYKGREWQNCEACQAIAAERELLECGHPKMCLVEREVTNIEKNEGPLDDTEHCSVCVHLKAEREWVRALVLVEVIELQQKTRELAEGVSVQPHRRSQLWCALNWGQSLEAIIRQLNLTAPSSTEE